LATFIALLRAVNVGGTGLLPMKELSALCTDLGFGKVQTYIQSGNVVFESKLSEKSVRAKLEEVLTKRLGKKADVLIRTPSEMRGILEANPFPEAHPSRVSVLFLCNPVPKDWLHTVVAPGGEEIRLGHREVYIYYPDGMGRSKLKLNFPGDPGTARNINTIAKLVAMTAG
jgi:uncharacterized protein (DUF1697 family)